MVWLPDGENILMICLFVLTEFPNVTDGQTDTACQHRPCLCTASRGKNCLIQHKICEQSKILLDTK